MERMKMDKRGQLTAFIILGILVLAVIILVFYMRGQFFFGPVTSSNLANRIVPIREHITGCVQEVSPEPIERIGMQGGHLKTGDDTYRNREGIPISYLCYNIEGQPQCYNRMLLISEMEKELNDAIKKGLATCVNVNQYKKGFDMQTGSMEVETDIGDENIVVTVKYPITLIKGDAKITEDMFSVNFNYPLGRLYDVSQDIIDMHTEFGGFDQLSYMLDHRGQYLIEVKKPYPDTQYILQAKDKPYLFQFFIQGEPA
ncbi:MAG TPA: hypothetical protein VJC07_04105 [Candidatus Nanoarchaeia archaeon]|nr:hypothetical protein [Candidatus Nanoarchaeia archaeon]